MFEAIMEFPDQIEISLKSMENWFPKHEYIGIQNILITGMGGSAIGGDFVSSLANEYCSIPIIVNRSYEIPGINYKKRIVVLLVLRWEHPMAFVK